MKVLALIFLLFFSFFSFTQTDKSNRYIPYFQTLKANKLAYHLTKNLETDSEKVVAIHSWIIHNIGFDINRWLSFNYSQTPIKKILFKRKAISTDYSRLFNEICKYSNIPAVTIQGYVKNEYTDYLDKFYLDEQSWNAVKLNNSWYLIDACMDAGKIEYYKRTFAGYFIFAFSFGTSDRLVYKPHFSNKNTKTYFCKNGYFFKNDHFPSNPIWQLTNPTTTLNQFELDSSAYFEKFDTLSKNSSNDDFSVKRDEYLNTKENDKEISEGFQSFKTNVRNNYGISKSYYLQALKQSQNLNIESENKENTLQIYDSIKKLLFKSKIHSDTNIYFLKNQKNELMINNLKKKELISKQNKTLISSTDKTIKLLNSGLKIGIVGEINLKATLQKNKILKRKAVKNKQFKKTSFGKKSNLTDSTLFMNRIKLFSDSILITKKQIEDKLAKLTSIHTDFVNNMTNYSINSDLNNKTTKELCDLRLSFIDDLDFPVRKLKDSLLVNKIKDDSLLYDSKNGAIVSYFYSEFNTIKKDFDNLYKFNLINDLEYCKLKKSIKQNEIVIEEHKNFINAFEKNMKSYNSILKTFKNKFNEIFKLSKNQIEPTKKENHSYIKEQFIEFQMNATRSSFINRHFKEQIKENKDLKSKASKLNKKIEKDITKIKLK